MNKIWIFILIAFMLSCKENVKKEIQDTQNEQSKETIDTKDTINTIDTIDTIDTNETETINDTLTVVEKVIKPHHNIDTLDFDAYNDGGDYFLISAKKNNELLSFINKDEDRSFLKGDGIEFTWKQDTISMAGDEEEKQVVKSILHAKKIKDGNVSKFRKEYAKKLKYNLPQENNFSQSSLEEIYLLVEYYIANSNNELIKKSIENKEQLEYTIEKQTKNDKEYLAFGISNTFENKTNTLQWLYFESGEYTKLYEYDLSNDELIKFE